MPSSLRMLGEPPGEVFDRDRRKTERQLIDQQQLGLAYDRATERQHLAFAPGQETGKTLAQRGERREERKDQRFELTPFGRIGAMRRCDDQVFSDREVGKYLVAFRHQHDAARGIGVRRLVFDALAGEGNATAGHACVVDSNEARDRAQRRGLAGAVVAEHGDDGLRHDFK